MNAIRLQGQDGKHFTPPMFSHFYELATTKETNEKGTWYGWTIEIDGLVEDSATYLAAKGIHELATSGALKTAEPGQQEHTEGDNF